MKELTYKIITRGCLSVILIGFISLSFLIGLYLGISRINYPKHAPSDYINESQIEIYPDKFCVLVNDSRVTSYARTGSMKNTLDENSNGIEIPANQSVINIGDIVSYENDGVFSDENNTQLIVHRVVAIRTLNNQTQYLTKGDSNRVVDGWINQSQIIYKTITIIYTFFGLERFIN